MRRRLAIFKHPGSLNVWIISVSVLLAVLGQAVIELVVHILGGKTSSSLTWLIGTVLVVLVVTVGILSNIYNRVDELANRLGLSIEYYRLDPGPHSSKRDQQAQELYSACIRAINSVSERAGSQIFAVNSFVEISNQAGDSHVEAASRRYLTALDSKIGRIPYQRVVQLSDDDIARLPQGSIADLIVANYREHYQHIVSAGENSHGQKAATVDAVRAKYPISFVVLHDASDSEFGGRLIWQMHEHVYDSKRRMNSVQLTGVFIIRDPDGAIVQTFFEWFEELTKSQDRFRLKSQNLEGHGTAVALVDAESSSRRPASRSWRRSGGAGNDTGRFDQ
jgi:hypothetical protein